MAQSHAKVNERCFLRCTSMAEDASERVSVHITSHTLQMYHMDFLNHSSFLFLLTTTRVPQLA